MRELLADGQFYAATLLCVTVVVLAWRGRGQSDDKPCSSCGSGCPSASSVPSPEREPRS